MSASEVHAAMRRAVLAKLAVAQQPKGRKRIVEGTAARLARSRGIRAWRVLAALSLPSREQGNPR
jgi:hypothetical protein